MINSKLKEKIKKQNKKDPNRIKKEPMTIEKKRDLVHDFICEDNREINEEENLDEFEAFFTQSINPKILITTCEYPTSKSFEFLQDLKNLIPNSFYYPRKKRKLGLMAQLAMKEGFTHVIYILERLKEPYYLSICVLPNPQNQRGITITYRIRSYVPSYKIQGKGNPSGLDPELILQNFNTGLGRRVGRQFASLFSHKPNFKDRTVVTFYNNRDFIFVRHHRYLFSKKQTEEEGSYQEQKENRKEAKDNDINQKVQVNMQEIGPRFNLQLRKVYSGYFDEVNCEYEFLYKGKYYEKRNKFYL